MKKMVSIIEDLNRGIDFKELATLKGEKIHENRSETELQSANEDRRASANSTDQSSH